MPDPVVILRALAAGFASAAGILLLCAWPLRKTFPRLAPLAAVLGMAAGFYVGCLLLGVKPHWPPVEDQDRWLLILFPATIGVEVLGGCLGRYRRLVWALRLLLAASAARVLLHNTSYLADLDGPGSAEWGQGETWLILGALALGLGTVWASIAVVARRAPGRSVPLALAVACAGAALGVMLSGYASGGQMGLPLAASLAGVVLASVAFSAPFDHSGVVGIGVVGLFALLVIGCFFGQLVPGHALLLFFAPLLGWLPEAPYICRLRFWLRGGLRVLLTAVPVAIAVMLAQQKFVENSARSAPGAQEPSLEDYMNFGK